VQLLKKPRQNSRGTKSPSVQLLEKAAPKAGFGKSRTQTLEGLKAPQFKNDLCNI